ncbi:RNA-binding protein [Chloroflexota bacterium]
MAEECCSNQGCGCGTTNLYSEEKCPDCGRRLRITGNLQQIKLYLTCPECGFQSPQLSMDKLRVLID